MVRFRDTKEYKLAVLMGGDPESWTQEERAILAVEGMTMDVLLSMATGNISTWIQLAQHYDPDKPMSDQSMEFQRQAAVTAASAIGMGLFLHATGVSSIEFMIGRSVAMSPITKVARHPMVVVPAGVLYAVNKYPEIAGPQYQSAMTGNVGIGSSVLSLKQPKRFRDVFTWEYWRGY